MSQSTLKLLNRASLIILVVSFAFTGVGLFLGCKSYRFSQKGIPAQATIVKLSKEKNNDGETVHKPVYTFTDENGLLRRAYSSLSTRKKIGDKLDILYLRDNPEETTLDNALLLWMPAGIFLLFGGSHFITFLVIYLFTKRRLIASSKDTA